jgi:thiamine pyrophosphate-dependent acetolactate synthase large subunit-like protein
MKIRLDVYDPPMCCSTGVCGSEVDPALVRFAGDLAWLEGLDCEVRRFNLAQEPLAFTGNAVIRQLLEAKGGAALPALLVGDTVVHQGSYPTRGQLAERLGLGPANSPRRSLEVVPSACGCGPDGCC